MPEQAVTFILNTDRDSFIAWLENWWSDWVWGDAGLGRIPTETGGYIGVSNLLTEDRKRGAILRKAELFYMLPQQDDPESWVCYDGLRGFEWAIVSLGAERCEVEFTTYDERLLPFYWQAMQAVRLRWPDVQWIEISPPIEASAPESQPAQAKGSLTAAQEETLRRLWANDQYNYDQIAAAMGLEGQGEFVRKKGYDMGLNKRKIGRKRGGN